MTALSDAKTDTQTNREEKLKACCTAQDEGSKSRPNDERRNIFFPDSASGRKKKGEMGEKLES